MEGREIQCVGKLEIARPKPVGFLCGSIPVPTDKAFHSFSSALIPSRQTSVAGAPRYRMLPTETDLNSPPLPLAAHRGIPSDSGAVASNLARKSEALAVSGVADYGDEMDVIAPADILKQIFRIPYSKARLSIAVQRIGQTLVLNPGPDVEEGEKFRRRHNGQAKSADQSLFLNFAMHSVRVEACDCPPTHHAQTPETPSSSVLPGVNKAPQVWGNKKNERNKGRGPVKKVSQVGEKPRSTMKESEKHKDDGFLRVLFWQFHNFRMLLGSDLMLFSNDKYLAVSLHLWDVTREITPLTWLEAWLDNVMASVPELAICYHQNGVVQGYELLKTDDIFLLKGISEDGTPAFHPYVVQQNGLSVLRFIQENCKQDPGAYWLYKSAGEDVIQLFDLSAISKNHASSDYDDCSSSIPSIVHDGRSDPVHSLGTLLYRIAHRLSLSMNPDKSAKSAKFIKQCLELLEEPDHLVVRAFAHEQFARLILNYDKNLELASEPYPVECKVTFPNDEEESLYFLSNTSKMNNDHLSSVAEETSSPYEIEETTENIMNHFSVKNTLEANASSPEEAIESDIAVFDDIVGAESKPCADESCTISELSSHVTQTVAAPISSKLAAIHHVSQAIKSLRWMHQRQSANSEVDDEDSESEPPDTPLLSENFSVCACGDPDCIEVCDIREWLPTSKLDHKLWKLVLLLGESYLALGHAYKEDGQLNQALKVVDLACSVYGSMPQHLKDSRFVSSMIGCPSRENFMYKNEKPRSCDGDMNRVISGSKNRLPSGEFSSVYLFWAKAWTLAGDIFAENYMVRGNDESKASAKEVKVPSEVVEEVTRLKKRLGQHMQNCSSCSLVNCSCQSDRANSGSSASSRSGDSRSSAFARKQNKKHSKIKTYTLLDNREDGNAFDREPDCKKMESNLEKHESGSSISDIAKRETPKDKDGGIFKYLRAPIIGDVEYLLSVSLSCYREAKNALGGLSAGSKELLSSVKKIGWVCNELGRYRLGAKELQKAEAAFAEAIKAFREVCDHTNIILINCNLGHGRRGLAETMVSKLNDLKHHGIFHNSYSQALETAKLEYGESLRYYTAAKSELNAVTEEAGSVPSSLRSEVFTQFANTYLRLGMLLAAEDTTTEIPRKARRETQKHEISANDAIREALAAYESLGDLRRQEAAFAYFQLGCHQRDCCLKFVESNGVQRVKRYFSFAESNWKKAAEFYGPDTHPVMYLTILIEKSCLLVNVSDALHSTTMLESGLSEMLEGRKVSETAFDSLKVEYQKLHSRFWAHIHMLLKKMVAAAMSSSQSPSLSNASADLGKLRQLYLMSLKSSDFAQLNAIYTLWAS